MSQPRFRFSLCPRYGQQALAAGTGSGAPSAAGSARAAAPDPRDPRDPPDPPVPLPSQSALVNGTAQEFKLFQASESWELGPALVFFYLYFLGTPGLWFPCWSPFKLFQASERDGIGGKSRFFQPEGEHGWNARLGWNFLGKVQTLPGDGWFKQRIGLFQLRVLEEFVGGLVVGFPNV